MGWHVRQPHKCMKHLGKITLQNNRGKPAGDLGSSSLVPASVAPNLPRLRGTLALCARFCLRAREPPPPHVGDPRLCAREALVGSPCAAATPALSARRGPCLQCLCWLRRC